MLLTVHSDWNLVRVPISDVVNSRGTFEPTRFLYLSATTEGMHDEETTHVYSGES